MLTKLTRCVKSGTLALEVKLMPVKNPRINVVLEKPLYHTIEHLANRDGVSLSLKVRDLVKEALEIEEDTALSAFAEKRERTFAKTKALKHHEVW
jgi:predicted DNA-binding ribbon-helix-helix protein